MITLAVFIFFDSGQQLLMTMCAMLIHESGHITGLIIKNIPFERVKIGITGANIVYGSGKLTSYNDDMFIAVMGSCFNFTAVLMALIVEFVLEYDLSFFIGINAFLGIFNMLPVLPLDGGRITLSLLSKTLDPNQAESIMRNLGIIVSIIGIISGVSLVFNMGNYTLVLVSIVIYINNKIEI